MKNSNGFTVFELLVGFVFLIMISYFLLTTILTIRDNQQLTDIKNKLLDTKILLTKEITDDLYDLYLSSLVSCGENCYDINFADGTTKQLSIDTTNNKMFYGDSEYNLIEDAYFVSSITATITTTDVTFTNRDNSLFKLEIPIKHYELEGEYGIDIIHSFCITGPLVN